MQSTDDAGGRTTNARRMWEQSEQVARTCHTYGVNNLPSHFAHEKPDSHFLANTIITMTRDSARCRKAIPRNVGRNQDAREETFPRKVTEKREIPQDPPSQGNRRASETLRAPSALIGGYPNIGYKSETKTRDW